MVRRRIGKNNIRKKMVKYMRPKTPVRSIEGEVFHSVQPPLNGRGEWEKMVCEIMVSVNVMNTPCPSFDTPFAQ
jgi:hypothetical protein